MRLNLPAWLNPWAEVRRLRDEAFARALAHGAEIRGLRAEIRGLRAEVEKQEALVDKAVHSLCEVQSCAAREMRSLRFELGRARCEADAWREKVMEIAATMPPAPPVLQLVKKEET